MVLARPKKIVLQTIGTRGDIQPYLAIAIGLQQAGYSVEIWTNSNHEQFCKEMGIPCGPVFADSEAIMREDPGIRKSMAEGEVLPFLKGLGEQMKKTGGPSLDMVMKRLGEYKPDLIMVGTMMEYFTNFYMYRLRIPVMSVKLQAFIPNRDRAPWGMPYLPFGLNEWMMKTVIVGGTYDSNENYDEAVEKTLGLKVYDVVNKQQWIDDMCYPPMPYFVGQSNVFAKNIHPNANENFKFIGMYAIPKQYQDNAAVKSGGGDSKFGSLETRRSVERFVAAGSKPAYMGWGSMMCKSAEYMCVLVAKAAKRSGLRVILLSGWAEITTEILMDSIEGDVAEYAKDNILVVGNVSHDFLFPQCCLAVHHGGSGTMSTVAKAGIPMIVTPVFLDQFDQAEIVNTLGIGHGYSKALKKLTPEELGDAMRRIADDEEVAEKTREVGEELRKENAVKTLVDAVQPYWDEWIVSGKQAALIDERMVEVAKKKAASEWFGGKFNCCS